MTKGAGLRPEAKATEPPPDPTVGAPVLDSTVIRSQFGIVLPSSDALLTVVHLPPVEIREMIDDDEDVSRFKRESTGAAEQLQQRIS